MKYTGHPINLDELIQDKSQREQEGDKGKNQMEEVKKSPVRRNKKSRASRERFYAQVGIEEIDKKNAEKCKDKNNNNQNEEVKKSPVHSKKY